MRTFFAIGFAMAGLLAAPALADKSVKPAEAVGQNSGAASPRPAKPAAQQPAIPKRVLAQQEAMKALKLADGDWRGPSKVLRKQGWVDMVETQRVATLLDGTVRTIESKGYEADGTLSFSMLAVIS